MKLSKPINEVIEELEAYEDAHQKSLDYLLNTEHDTNFCREIDHKNGAISAFRIANKELKAIL